jgi:lipopolysaccharide export system protein LptC
MATHVNVHPAQMRFGGLKAAPDRKRAFTAARRHSFVVKLLKLGLPVAALSVAALYVLPSRLTVPIKGGEASVEALDLTSSGGLKMVNPRIKGVHDKFGVYDIRADSALQHVKEPEVMTFDAITADIVSSQGEKTTLTAPSGIFHSKKEEMTFDSGVTIGGEAGLSGTLKTATAYMKENRLISQDPLTLTYHGHTIASDSVEIWTSENRAIFTGNVRVHLERAETEGMQQ